MKEIEIITIGTSAGGVDALDQLLPELSAITRLPIVVVIHLLAASESYLIQQLANKCQHEVLEATADAIISENKIYFAPGDYHLYIEHERRFSLSHDLPVNYSRPSIDVTFESIAEVYRANTLAILLTGANDDGASGLHKVQMMGGATIAQDPETSYMSQMPQAAIELQAAQNVLILDEVVKFIQCSFAFNGRD